MRYWKSKQIAGKPVVSILAAAYVNDDERLQDALLAFLYCIKAQTWPHWQLLIVHDGPVCDRTQADFLRISTGDKRLCMASPVKRKKQFGHPYRQMAIDLAGGDFITLTNADNLYAPTFLESLLDVLVNQQADFAYCDFVHSHQHWAYFKSEPRRSKLDLGAFMARASLVKSVPFDDYSFAGDGAWIDKLVKKSRKTVKVLGAKGQPACLFVHN